MQELKPALEALGWHYRLSKLEGIHTIHYFERPLAPALHQHGIRAETREDNVRLVEPLTLEAGGPIQQFMDAHMPHGRIKYEFFPERDRIRLAVYEPPARNK